MSEFLPTTLEEINQRGWEQIDFYLLAVTLMLITLLLARQ